jgi:hypothetical protein
MSTECVACNSLVHSPELHNAHLLPSSNCRRNKNYRRLHCCPSTSLIDHLLRILGHVGCRSNVRSSMTTSLHEDPRHSETPRHKVTYRRRLIPAGCGMLGQLSHGKSPRCLGKTWELKRNFLWHVTLCSGPFFKVQQRYLSQIRRYKAIPWIRLLEQDKDPHKADAIIQYCLYPYCIRETLVTRKRGSSDITLSTSSRVDEIGVMLHRYPRHFVFCVNS